MRVAIHSVDGMNFPNLALMRISAWHKAQGDDVEWFAPLMRYDRVYASKVFRYTPDDPYLPANAIRGGTGYDSDTGLPPGIEKMPPDYTMYPQFTAAYGFLTRGCPNNCPWCVVPHKEGSLRVVADIAQICQTNTGFRRDVVLMDNNFLAAPLGFIRAQIRKAKDMHLRLDFNQATDARLYTDETAQVMASVHYLKWARLACDTDAQLPACLNAIRLLRKYGCRKDIMVYVMAKNDGIESALARISALAAADPRTVPFVMPYRSLEDNSVLPSAELKQLARWCNRVWIRKSCSFQESNRKNK